jgi:hypothetical protein
MPLGSLYIFFFTLYVFSLFTNYKEDREEMRERETRKEGKKKTLEAHQSSDNNTTCTVEKISIR